MGRLFDGEDAVRARVLIMLCLASIFCRVLAQVDGKMVKPTPERPLEGIITISSEISPMASSDYETGR